MPNETPDAERLLSDPTALDVWAAERKRLCDAATKGPWTVSADDENGACYRLIQPEFWRDRVPKEWSSEDQSNAELIADARTSLPTAMEVMRRLREQVVGLQTGREHFSRSGLRGTQCCDVVIDGMIGGAIDELKRLRERVAELEAERPKEWRVMWESKIGPRWVADSTESTYLTRSGADHLAEQCRLSPVRRNVFVESRDAAGEWTRE